MILSLLYILRIFSEQINILSPIIGGVLILLAIDQILMRKSNFTLWQNGPFFNFWFVYTIITLFGVVTSYFYYGSILVVPGFYVVVKLIAILCLFLLLQSGKFISHGKLPNLLTIIIYIYSGIAIIDTVCLFTDNLGFFSKQFVDDARAVWPANHPNSLGTIFSILSAYLIISKNIIPMRKFLIVILIIGLFSTKSLSSVGILIAILGLHFLNKDNYKNFLIISATIPLIYLAVGELTIGGRIKSLNTDLKFYRYAWEHKTSINPYNPWTNSLEWRFANWRNFYNIMLEHPLFGKGTLCWKIENPYRDTTGELGGINPHSELFGWLAQFGLVGTTILLFVSTQTCFALYKSKKNSGKTFEIIFIAILITGLFGKEILYVQIYYLLMLDMFSKDEKLKIRA